MLIFKLFKMDFILFSDRVQASMDSDSSDPMAPDEMYLMLQADMVCNSHLNFDESLLFHMLLLFIILDKYLIFIMSVLGNVKIQHNDWKRLRSPCSYAV